jgi:hypothetical protein
MVSFFARICLMASMCLVLGASAEMESGDRFVVEFSKSRIFQGETVLCNFVLYSMEDRMEVEVAKFPEFRGFWSENSALRQGPMMLLPDQKFMGLRKAMIGTYSLTAMMGYSSPKVTPMRLVLKNLRQLAGPQEKSMLSELPTLTILPLPKPPPDIAPIFTGGVGQFHLRTETPTIRYYAKEPLALRFVLAGSGNFAELNTMPVNLPAGVSLVSQRTSLMGSGAFQNKVFEWVVTVDSESGMDLPPLRWAFFDPSTARYEVLTADPIHLEAVTRPPDIEQKEVIDLGPAETHWHSTQPLETSFWFKVLNVLVALLWGTLVALQVARRFKAKRAADPWVKLKARWTALLEQPKTDAAEWLRDAEGLVFDTVSTQSKVPFTTRRQALQFAARRFGAETAVQVEQLFKTFELTRYSPNPPPPPSRGEMTPPLQRLRSSLFGRARRP